MADNCYLGGAKPSHYDVRIEPDVEKGTFEGTVCIKMKIIRTESFITLNCHELDIGTTLLYDLNGKLIPVSSTNVDKKLQNVNIHFAANGISEEEVVLRQTFSGKLSKTAEGFHHSGVTTPMLSTNLEPTAARAVFPCFDDPSQKATFSVTLVVPKDLTCLGNMPIKSKMGSAKDSTKNVIEFEKTPAMSTYLVAFAVGNFNFIESHDFQIPIKAYAPPDYEIEHCRFALETAGKALDVLEEMFHFKYPLPKLDLLSVPFNIGGMENWGLITLSRQVMVLPADSTANAKTVSAQMITHELAHQWFGNLVTMKSWDNYWLKEALADWVELEVRTRLLGSEELVTDFVADSLQSALGSDSGRYGHPLEVAIDGITVKKPFYDNITYKKGCAVLKMVSSYLGKELFLQGLRSYVANHAYQNTEPEDLWKALRAVSGIDVDAFIRPWTTKTGYPVIKVEEDEQSGTLTLTQDRFQMTRDEATYQNSTIYPLFLNIVTANGIIGGPLNDKTRNIKVPLDFFKLNANQTGFFRVSYGVSRIERLAEDINKEFLSAEDRIGIISDAAALVFAGGFNLRTSNLLHLLQSFEDELDFFVWKMIIFILVRIQKNLLYEEKDIQRAFARFWAQLLQKIRHKLGEFRESDELNEQRFKGLIFNHSAGDKNVTSAVIEMYERFMLGHSGAINPNIRAGVFEIILKLRGRKEYLKLFDKRNVCTPAERADILSSLGFAQNPKCISQTISLATSSEAIRNYETTMIMRSLASHEKGAAALWKWVTSGVWMTNPELSFETIAPVGALCLDAFTTDQQHDEARAFLDNVDTSTTNGNVEHALDEIESRARWIERDREDLRGWLDINGYGKPQSPVLSTGTIKSGWKELFRKIKSD